MIVKCTLNDGSSDHVLDDYIIDNGIQSLTVRVESDKPGEPGVVAFDGMSMEFDESDLGSLFTPASLAAAKAAGDKYTIKISLGFVSDYDVFYGMVDFDSVEYTQDGTVKFEVIDFIQALKYVTREDVRELGTLVVEDNHLFVVKVNLTDPKIIYLLYYNTNTASYEDWPILWEMENGITLKYAESELYGEEQYFFVLESTRVSGILDDFPSVIGNRLQLANDFTLIDPGLTQTRYALNWYSEEIYGEDYNYVIAGEVVGFDAFEIALEILDRAWPGLTVDSSDLTTDDYIVHYDHWENTGIGDYEKDIFGTQPAEMIVRLIAAMRLYMYFGMDGVLYFVEKPTTAGTPDLTIDTTSDNDVSWVKRFSWQKKIDCVHVTSEYAGSDDEAFYPDNLSETAEETLNVDVLKAHDYTLDELAEDIWEFYGKRHLAMTLTLPLTETVAAELGIMKQIRVDSVDYFLYEYTIDIENETVEMQLASYQTWEN